MRAGELDGAVVRDVPRRLTSRSTRPPGSITFIVVPSGLVVCFVRATGQFLRRAALLNLMKHHFDLVLACVLLLSTTASAQERVPGFADYPARVVRTRRSVKVRIHSTPDTACFRTMLRKTAREGRLFAGRYAIGYWGCGTCLRIGIVDLTSGRAYVTPFEASSAQGVVKVRRDSRLVVIDDAESAYGSWHYLWNGRRLLRVVNGEVERREPGREFLRCSEATRFRRAPEQLTQPARPRRTSHPPRAPRCKSSLAAGGG